MTAPESPSHEPPPLAAVRLVEHLRATVTRDERVLEAILATPREEFVPPGARAYAYLDEALAIGAGQTISQPTIVAMMTAALRLQGTERVLEIGTGSGYQAAILARLCRHLVTVEMIDELRERAAGVLQRLGIENVTVLPAGDEIGAPDLAPFDAIIVTAAAPGVPAPLLDQLAPHGRMVIPVGPREEQRLLTITIDENRRVVREDLGACRFVPLTGAHGFAT